MHAVAYDVVQKAQHYNSHPSGVEAKHVVRTLNFNLGNVFKYVFRREGKETLRSLKSALFYLDDEYENHESTPRCTDEYRAVWGLMRDIIRSEKDEDAKRFYNEFEYLVLDYGQENHERTRKALLQLIANNGGSDVRS
jgi:hypothetical protein